MFITKVSILSFTVLFLAASGPSAPARTAASRQSCTGCVGSGGSSSMSAGTGAGFVSMLTTVTKGKCKWVLTNEDWTLVCIPFKGCTQTTTSIWGGLEQGSLLDLCVREGDEVLRCDSPTVVVAPGGAGVSLSSSSIPCGSEAQSSLVYSVVSESSGLSASAEVSCSACAGS